MITHPFKKSSIEAISEKPEIEVHLNGFLAEIDQLSFISEVQQLAGFQDPVA